MRACSMFHMGEILITGNGAEEYIQKMVTNDISKMVEGRVVYCPCAMKTEEQWMTSLYTKWVKRAIFW